MGVGGPFLCRPGGGPRRRRPVCRAPISMPLLSVPTASHERRSMVGGGVPGVSDRGGDPPGPIPNPVVPTASAGEVLGGQLPGKCGPCARHPAPHRPSSRPSSSLRSRRGVEQRQLVGLITQRSWVRIPPPLPFSSILQHPSDWMGAFLCSLDVAISAVSRVNHTRKSVIPCRTVGATNEYV